MYFHMTALLGKKNLVGKAKPLEADTVPGWKKRFSENFKN